MPLVIGVTGHLKLREGDLPALRRSVERVFEELRARHPATPLLVLSPLAEGADRLVARAALDQGLRLIAPLPMRRELYEQDFEGESLLEFRELLDRAERWLELPLVDGLDEADLAAGRGRARQYDSVGAFLVRHCHLLLALWDGDRAAGSLGGTTSIVEYKLRGVPPRDGTVPDVLDPPDVGPVWHVLAPRASEGAVRGAVGTLTRRYPEPVAPHDEPERAVLRAWRRLDRFNRDALGIGPRLEGALAASAAALASPQTAPSVPGHLQVVRETFALADVLAVHNQRLARRALIVVLGLVFAGALWLALGSAVGGSSWIDLLYGLTVLAVGGIQAWAWRSEAEVKYQDYRALAEGLRVQFAWASTGLRERVTDHYLRVQKGELEWIRDAIRATSLEAAVLRGGEARPPEEALAAAREVSVRWVEGQRRYFVTALERELVALRRLRRATSAFFLLGLLFVWIRILLPVFAPDAVAPAPAEYDAVTATLSLSPAISALLYSFIRISALPEHTRRYGRMVALFTVASERLAQVLDDGDADAASAILRQLGQEALIENGMWLILHRERTVAGPFGRRDRGDA